MQSTVGNTKKVQIGLGYLNKVVYTPIDCPLNHFTDKLDDVRGQRRQRGSSTADMGLNRRFFSTVQAEITLIFANSVYFAFINHS